MHIRPIALILFLLMTSCALKEEAELVMPASPARLFVEGYLVPGEPIRLSLIRTSSFQEDLSLQLVWNAHVELMLPDTVIRLQNIFYKDKVSGKMVNYASPYRLPAILPEDSVRLRIITVNNADTLYAATETVAPVVITDWVFNGTQIRLSFTNGPDARHRFYGVYLEYELAGQTIRKSEYYDYSLSSEPELSIRLDVPDGKQPYRIILYRITPDNYHFQRALQQASRSNVDPFEPPVVLPSNVQGGQGIFTYSTQDTLVIE
ncbi:DUF4249 family protein [Pontibacter arcticus]|uniref:DUF4249 domain-containing protein n=1 Tax=Pontibacter arcticus TaxID=2080288 RepID=A0A364RB78_9BACT|nr:DUF4249 family protein [Pontibacter arcticus]RAU81331.1 hypothetical protein DP923_15975 [Pontibacter arcticus]RAU81396.1 hypothetical protein DP923_16320 [Pontibacter arcticus]